MVGRIQGGTSVQALTSTSVSNDKEVKVEQVEKLKGQTREETQEPLLSTDKAKQMTDSMNQFLQSVNTQLRFQFHDELNEYYVTIVDTVTNDVVREIPPKKLMDIYAAMKELVGLIVDRKI